VSAILLFVTVVACLPSPVDAALVPCGRSSGTAAEMAPCTVCHIIVGAKTVIDWGMGIMTYVALAVIVAMAIMYIVSAGDQTMMGRAKEGIKASLVGFAIMLLAWLMVNVTINLLSATIDGLTVSSSGFTFSCDTSSNASTGS